MRNLASKARPYFGAVVLTCGLLTAGGIYSATRMPSGVYPEVTFPRVSVVARVPDFDVTRQEVKVTRPLEEAVSTVLGVVQVRSKTIRGGSEISLEFAPGTDMNQAITLTWNRIGARRSDLPATMDLVVEQMTPSALPLVNVVLTGGDNPSQLRDYAFYQLAPLIKTIPDVLYANVSGGDVREIEVIARPDDLLAAGLSASDLADQISQQSSLQPVGRVEGQPFAFQLLVNNQPERVRQVEEMVVSIRKDQPLRVRDVADVKVMHQDRVQSIGFDKRDAVVITVFRRLGGNAVNVARDLRALLARYDLDKPFGTADKRPPRNIQAVLVSDQAHFIETAVHNVRDAILIGGAFSVLILLAFLRSWRATLISVLAIPTTLAITFLFLYSAGATLNLMSLGGLAVAIGLIIDDTVVVVENIARHLSPQARGQRTEDRGQNVLAGNGQSGTASTMSSVPCPPSSDPIDAASGEITGAVVGSTLTTVLVFVPLAFIAGVYGQFFAALSWSLSIAVLVSMVISLTLIPVFAAKFLAGRTMRPPGPIYERLASYYESGLSVALRFPRLTLTLSIAAVAVCVVLVTGIPDWTTSREPGKPPPAPWVKGLETGLMPAMDEGTFILDYWAPSGSPLVETERTVHVVEEVLSKNPDVDVYVRRTGTEHGFFATQTSRGDIQITLRPAPNDPLSLLIKPVRPALDELEAELKKENKSLDDPAVREEVRRKYRRRPITGWTDRSGKKQPGIMDEIDDEIKELLSEHQLKIEMVQMMADEINDLSGANKPIEIKLFGPDQRTLRKLAAELGEKLEDKKGPVRGIREANSNVFAGNPDLMLEVDVTRAERLGIKPDAIGKQLKAMFFGQIAAQVQESSTRITDVRVRYPDAERFGRGRFDPDRVLRQWVLLPPPVGTNVPVAGAARAVPVSAVATLKSVRTPDQQFRENQQPVAIITAEINEAEAGLGTVVNDIRHWMADVDLPAGYRWDIGGHFLKQQEAFRSLLVVMIVAVLLVFIMLAFQFQSVMLPLLIFLTQPLSIVCGLLALWLTGTPLNVSSYMGAILLVGLDMKNGILLVEYIQQLRAEGMDLRPALVLAGRTRFRPILMTSLAAVLGLLPLALGIGPGAQMQQPLAIMVIGGLTANMLFTRMVIPVGYLIMEGGMADERLKRPESAKVPAGAVARVSGLPPSPPVVEGSR
jgi:multidrug efflux pump subunit AcrB